MRVAWTITLLAASTMGHVLAQSVNRYVPPGAKCNELNLTVLTQVTNGQFAQAESLLSSATASSADRIGDSCRGFVLVNVAVQLSISGRIAEAVRFAE